MERILVEAARAEGEMDLRFLWDICICSVGVGRGMSMSMVTARWSRC